MEQTIEDTIYQRVITVLLHSNFRFSINVMLFKLNEDYWSINESWHNGIRNEIFFLYLTKDGKKKEKKTKRNFTGPKGSENVNTKFILS